MSNMNDQPWYKNGLRFRCAKCGNCCTGAPGFVWVNQAEIEKMAALCNMEVAEFEKTYVRKVGIRKSLKECRNGDCVFFDGEVRGCAVYSCRPRQCGTWPFWNSNLRTPQAWQETCETCPGSGRGPLVSGDEVRRRAAVISV